MNNLHINQIFIAAIFKGGKTSEGMIHTDVITVNHERARHVRDVVANVDI